MKKPQRFTKKKGGPDIKQIFDTWIAGYAEKSVKQVMSIYEAEATFHEPCYPVQTFTDLSDWFRLDFARSGPRPTWKYSIESLDQCPELAVVVTRWQGFIDAGTDVQGEVRSLRSIDFLRPGPNGWRIFRTLNNPEPCPGAKQPARKKRRRKAKRR